MQPPSNGQQPVYILQQGTEQTNGSVAQKNNINAAKAVADAVRTTLGPLGMDKMLIDPAGNIMITNDGVSILREIGIEHPSAKMMVEVAKTQEQLCWDGTTSAVVLAGALLSEAEDLLDKGVHPTTICKGFLLAKQYALEQLDAYAKDVRSKVETMEGFASRQDHERFITKSVAQTALTGKSSEGIQDLLSAICSYVADKAQDRDNVKLISASGREGENSTWVNGVVIEKEFASPSMENFVGNLKEHTICLLDCAIEPKKTNAESQIQFTNHDHLQDFLMKEEESIKEMVENIRSSGANVVFTQKKIDDLALHYLKAVGISAVHSVKKSDLEALSLVAGATIISSLSSPITEFDLGSGIVEVIDDYDHKLISISNDLASYITVIAVGSTKHVAEELERAMDDAIGVALMSKEGNLVTGAGSAYMNISCRMKDNAEKIANGRVTMAVSAFAEALTCIPASIAENAGLDPLDEILALTHIHKNSKLNNFAGVSVDPDLDYCAFERGVFEPKEVVAQAIRSATEASIMILRIDDVIRMKGEAPN